MSERPGREHCNAPTRPTGLPGEIAPGLASRIVHGTTRSGMLGLDAAVALEERRSHSILVELLLGGWRSSGPADEPRDDHDRNEEDNAGQHG